MLYRKENWNEKKIEMRLLASVTNFVAFSLRNLSQSLTGHLAEPTTTAQAHEPRTIALRASLQLPLGPRIFSLFKLHKPGSKAKIGVGGAHPCAVAWKEVRGTGTGGSRGRGFASSVLLFSRQWRVGPNYH